jgi:hypothetical protein
MLAGSRTDVAAMNAPPGAAGRVQLPSVSGLARTALFVRKDHRRAAAPLDVSECDLRG